MFPMTRCWNEHARAIMREHLWSDHLVASFPLDPGLARVTSPDRRLSYENTWKPLKKHQFWPGSCSGSCSFLQRKTFFFLKNQQLPEQLPCQKSCFSIAFCVLWKDNVRPSNYLAKIRGFFEFCMLWPGTAYRPKWNVRVWGGVCQISAKDVTNGYQDVTALFEAKQDIWCTD